MPSARRVLVVLFLIGLLPATITGVTDGISKEETPESAGDITANDSEPTYVVISTQGAWGAHNSGALTIVNKQTKTVVWQHTNYRRYMDVDPVNESTLFIVAGVPGKEGFNRKAVLIDWKRDEVLAMYDVPGDTHDVDWLGDGRMAVADKANHTAYIINTTTEDVEWKYRFERHYPDSAGGKASGDWTHVNDIDIVNNGSGVLLSPRNFNRVILVNKSTKNETWTLGEKKGGPLAGQHNPVLLSSNPPTVLVADSNNNRVVEFVKQNSSWKEVWSYKGSLVWPRDADRLPNGNTMITDTKNDRVLIISPSGKVTWEYSTRSHPYDIEILSMGDEPQGPTIQQMEGDIQIEDDFSTSLVTRMKRIEPVSVYLGLYPASVTAIDAAGFLVSQLSAAALLFISVYQVIRRRLN